MISGATPWFWSYTDDKSLCRSSYRRRRSPSAEDTLMKHFIALTYLIICGALHAGSAIAANHYVRAGAGGTGSGTDWTNAYSALPSTLVRGDTYYIADGTYGPYVFDDALSSINVTRIVKATAANHGADTGWVPTYGDGEALFTGASPVWRFSTGYYDIDGVVGNGKATVSYGIRVMPTTTRCVNEFQSAVMFTGGANITNLALRHIDYGWNNGSSNCTAAVPSLFFTQDASSDYITIENSYFHHSPGYALYIGPYDPNPGGKLENHYTIRNNYFYMLGGGGGTDHHYELFWLMNVDNSDIYNNVFEDLLDSGGQTGWIMFAKANNLSIYNNLFFCTDAACIVGGNGVIATWSLDAYRNDGVKIYGNTFARLRGLFNDFGMRFTHSSLNDLNITVKNNLYCNTRFTWSGATTQTHESCGCGQPCSGTNQQTGLTTANFVNYAGNDFRLASATAAGDSSIGSQFQTDMNGRTRGADGVWDRGAFEFEAGLKQLQPPTNLRVVP